MEKKMRRKERQRKRLDHKYPDEGMMFTVVLYGLSVNWRGLNS